METVDPVNGEPVFIDDSGVFELGIVNGNDIHVNALHEGVLPYGLLETFRSTIQTNGTHGSTAIKSLICRRWRWNTWPLKMNNSLPHSVDIPVET